MNGFPKAIYLFGDYRLIPTERMLLKGEDPILLPPKAFDILVVLVENAGELVDNKHMLEAVWPDSFVEEANIQVQMSSIRKILGENGKRLYIKTVPKIGYRFVADVIISSRGPVKLLQTDFDVGPDSPALDNPSRANGILRRTDRRSGSRDRKLMLAILLLFILGIWATWSYYFNRDAAIDNLKPITSIAVIPFINESGNADVEYLSDGMTETMINNLSQIPSLTVKARASVFRYKGKDLDIKKIASELKVQVILTGRVVQHGEQLSLYVALIDLRTENTLWGNEYERGSSDLVSLQSEVARDVSSKLKSKLSTADEAKITKKYTADTEAYQLYLQGLYHWNKRTPEDLRKSLALFQQATEKDPTYAQAYAWLAMTYSVINANIPTTRQELAEVWRKERAAARRALELDDSLAEPHVILAGAKKDLDWDFAAAEIEYRRAIELNPNFATARQWYSELLSTLGRRDEAWMEVNKAHEIDPYSRAINANIGLRLLEARRVDEAVAQYQKVIEMEPAYPVVHSMLATAYDDKGMYSEAVAENRVADTLMGKEPRIADFKAATLTKAIKTGGFQGYWRKHLELDLAEYEKGYASAFAVAATYARLGEQDHAFEWLEKSYSAHEQRLDYLKAEPAFDGISPDRRFTELLKRLDLPA